MPLTCDYASTFKGQKDSRRSETLSYVSEEGLNPRIGSDRIGSDRIGEIHQFGDIRPARITRNGPRSRATRDVPAG
jgi:hypothetical protein